MIKAALIFALGVWALVGLIGLRVIYLTLTGPSNEYGQIWWGIAISTVVWGGIMFLLAASLDENLTQ